MKLIHLSLFFALIVILLMGFYMLIDNRLDKLEQADQNIVQGVNQALQNVTKQ